MAYIRDIIRTKGDTVYSLSSKDMVLDALQLMAQHDIGAVPIIDDGHLSGIFSERIYARNVFLRGRASPTTPLADVMMRDVVTVGPSTTVEACMGLMNKNRIRHVPVMVENKVVGLISIGDLMNRIIEDQEFNIENLIDYVGH